MLSPSGRKWTRARDSTRLVRPGSGWPRPCIGSSRAPRAQQDAARHRFPRCDRRRLRWHQRHRARGSVGHPLSDQPRRAVIGIPAWRREHQRDRHRRTRMLMERLERDLLDSRDALVRSRRVRSHGHRGCQPAAQHANGHRRRQRSPGHDRARGIALPVHARPIRHPHQRCRRSLRRDGVRPGRLRMDGVGRRTLGARADLVARRVRRDRDRGAGQLGRSANRAAHPCGTDVDGDAGTVHTASAEPASGAGSCSRSAPAAGPRAGASAASRAGAPSSSGASTGAPAGTGTGADARAASPGGARPQGAHDTSQTARGEQ